MINLEEKIKEIENTNRLEITTKELKELGMNDYYIKKACENGSLEKIVRGKYKIIATEKDRERTRTFNAFTKAVFNDDFEGAYDSLVKNVKAQTNHDYDYHLKLYSIMLKKLLPSNKDFSFADDIIAFCDIPNNETYYRYFVEFTEAVLSGDFTKAYNSIGRYRKEEREGKGYNCISTKLFNNLAYCIQEKLAKESNPNEENLRIVREKRKKYLYKESYTSLKENIEKENYQAALINIEDALKYTTKKGINNLTKMKEIITKYLEIKESKEPLTIQEIDYEDCQEDYNKIFNKAISSKDYQTAYKNIGKCIYFNKTSTTLQLYRSLLHVLIEENNKNQKTSSTKEIISEANLPKEDEKVQKESVKEETMPEREQISLEVDINDLLDLIYDRKYDEVKELLKGQENSNNLMYRTIMNMIRYMDNLKNSNVIREREVHIYQNDCSKIFKRFFEALNNRCYDEAYNLVDDCIEISERNNDSEKFQIYKYLLEDILDLKDEVAAKSAKIKKIQELTKIQTSIIPNHVLEAKDFQQLETTTLEKIELSKDDNLDTTYDKHIIEMLEVMENVDKYHLDNNSFESFEYSENEILERFLKVISLGDYQAAYQISKEEKWYEEMKKSKNKNYLIIYKKLLARIDRKINTNSLPVKHSQSKEPLEENPLINHLETLKSLVKKRKFQTAYTYYEEHNLEGISEDLDIVLKTLLPFIKVTVENEAQEIEESYKEAMKVEDYSTATRLLDEYQEFIKFNDLERIIDYHKARIISGKKESETDNHNEKKELYRKAVDCFKNSTFLDAIELLTEYINMDNDISANGYLLRGRCYEKLKRFNDAKADYEKAISIIPEPNAYHRLGKINCYQKNYESAIENFLEYEERRPVLHKANLYALRDTYKILGQDELSEKYKELIKKFPENKKTPE